MKQLNCASRFLCCLFAVQLALPMSVWAQLTITGPTFPTTNTLRVALTGAESTNAHVILWTPTFISDINSWTRLTTGSVGQTVFDFGTTTNRQSYFRAGIAPVATPTVSTPVFAPGGGSYGTPTNVTITCATAGAAIYFTTNGSTPTILDNYIYDGSSVYLASAVTLKAKAFKTGYNDSAVASATYTINSAPFVSAGAQQILTATTNTLRGVVLDDGLTGGGTRFTNWSKITGPGTVTFGNTNQTNSTATFSLNGIYTLKLAACDGQYTNSSTVTIAVNPTLSVEMVEPGPLTTVSVPTNLLLRAEASCTSGSVTQVQFFANGTYIGTATNSAFSFYWRSVPLGTNLLMAVAHSDDAANSSLASTNTVALIVNWPADIGRVTMAETDISIPAAGLPLTLNRLYDSKRGTNGAFGENWRTDSEDIHIEKLGVLSDGWLGTYAVLAGYCVRPSDVAQVRVTFGDGQAYYFSPVLKFDSIQAACEGSYPIFSLETVHYEFLSLSGQGSLSATPPTDPVGMNDFGDFVWPGLVAPYTDDGFGDPDIPYEPDNSDFTFTAPDGMRYTFNSDGSLRQKIDRNDNTVSYNPNDITWSNPNTGASRQLTLTRDGDNRITEVYDPIGGSPALKYDYDGSGNLTNVARLIDRTGPVYENTGYAYTNTTYAHAITAITDPRGVTSQRYEYDGSGRLAKQTDALNRFISHTYDTANRRQTVVDRLFNTTVQTFTPAGQLASVSDAGGAVTSYLYDSEGRRSAEINPLGLTNTFAYDGQDNLLASTNEIGAATSATYDEFGQVLTSVDARGAGTTNEYDANGNLIAVTNALGVVSGYGYDLLGNRLAETNAVSLPEQVIVLNDYNEFGWLTNTTTLDASLTPLTSAAYIYDDNGNRQTETRVRSLPGGGTENVIKQWNFDGANRVTSTLDALGGTNRTSYNGLGKQALTVDALNRTNRFDYDAVGLLTNTVFADGLNEQYGYDAEGRRTSSVDRAQRTTSYTYDALGRLQRTTFPDLSYTENTYDAAGRLQTSALGPVPGGFGPPADAQITSYDYDAAGRRTNATDALNQTTLASYDANGNVTNTVDALLRTNRYEFDALNRQIRMTFPDNTSETAGYNALDRKVAVTNQANVVTRFGYDALGRLKTVTNAFGTAEQMVTRYDYDELGNLLRQIDALSRTNSFEYDALGRRLKETMPQGQVQRFAYDAVGNLKLLTNFNSVVLTNKYDALNRLTNKASAGGYGVSFAYSATGQRTTMTDASGTNSYSYDNRDRLLTNSWAIIATNQTMTLAYAYNAFGNLASVTSSSTNGTLVNYVYDALNRLTNVTDRFAQGATYAFDAVGNLDTARYPSLVTNRWKFDALNRLTNVSATSASGMLSSFSYKLAAAGNRTNLIEAVNGSPRTNAWAYDALYRLATEGITGTAPTGNVTNKYDAVGNRTNRTSTLAGVTNQSFAFTGNDWLTNDAYDSNGNTRTNGANSYTYDAENRLTNFNAGTAIYIHDGDGNRKIKIAGGVTTYFLVDNLSPSGHAQVLEEHSTPNATPVRLYTHGLDLICERQDGVTSYYGYDGNGNTRFLTGTNAAITDTYVYDAFGILVTNTGTTTNFYRYTGEQFDTTLGMTYLRARYVNSGTGRFLNRDSFEGSADEPMSLHRYLYAHNDPVNNIDPSGNEIEGVLTALSIGGMFAQITTPGASGAQAAARRVATKEGTPKNLAKRKAIDETARGYNGSKLWRFDVKKDDFPVDSNKCNKFVYDVTKKAGALAQITIKGTKRPPLAAEYADSGTKIPNWRALKSTEKAEPGDIAAYKLADGGAAYSGHTGFITKDGNISAHGDGVYPKPGQFENADGTVYRRYTGE